MERPEPSLVFALALGAGVLAQLVARHLRLPSIVLLLAVGVVLGPDGLGWVLPHALGDGLFAVVSLAVAVILFEGGLNLELRRLRREGAAIRTLVTVGALVTAIGGTLAARLALGWSWDLALLFGTLVIVTGPTVVRPLLRNVPLTSRLATVLEAEGVLIDPIGAIVAALALQIVLAPTPDFFASGLLGLALRIGFGAAAGAGFGLLLGGLLRLGRVVPEGLENIVTLGAVLVLFEACETVLSESGILAVTVAGVVVANIETRVSRELREFKEHLTIALIAILFVLLAADVRIDDVVRLGWPGLTTVGALVFLVRPANVWLSTLRSELNVREKAFLSWVAPRGIVAAAVASLFAAIMEAEGRPGGPELRALVFLTIAVTVVAQGASAPWLARLLGVRLPGRDSAVILGAEELGIALGETLREGGVRVVFIDTNPEHCRAAEQREFAVVFGNALDERTLARARLERAKWVIGLTSNDGVNSLFAREARQEFGVRETYAAVVREGTAVSQILEKQESRILFDRPKDVMRWNVRLRHNGAQVRRFRFVGQPESTVEAVKENELPRFDPYIFLALQRGSTWMPMHTALEPKNDDVAAVALYRPEEAEAFAALAGLGWEALEPELEAEGGEEG
jgi:NhaP-type Na+/H+ or K+/H+ antiporter